MAARSAVLHYEAGARSHSIKLQLPAAKLRLPAATLLKAFSKSYAKKVKSGWQEVGGFRLATADGTAIDPSARCDEILGLKPETVMHVKRTDAAPAVEAEARPAAAAPAAPPRADPPREELLPAPLPLSDPAVGGFSPGELLALSHGPCPAESRAAVAADLDFWPDAKFWAAAFGLDAADMLWQRLPQSRDLFARISDAAFRGAYESIPAAARPPATRTHPLAHGYFPDFIDRVSDRAATILFDAVDAGFLARDARVLEVGCGNGRFSRSLEARRPGHGLRLFGLDVVDCDLARAHGGSPRRPWFPPAPPAAGGYAKVYETDLTDGGAVRRALDGARFDALVSVSTLFWMGFPSDDGPAAPSEVELGDAVWETLRRDALRRGAVAIVMTAGYHNFGHPFDTALEKDATLRVLRRGCLVSHARAQYAIIDLPIDGNIATFAPPPATRRTVLDEVDLAMEGRRVPTLLRNATRAVSVGPTLARHSARPPMGPFWVVRLA